MEKVKPKTAIAKFLENLPDKVDQNVNATLNKGMHPAKNYGEPLICELPSGKKIKFILKSVDPKKCRIWSGNLRVQGFVNKDTTNQLKERIQAQGQLVPVLARTLKDDPIYTHEIIYGSRRHFVCSLLGIEIRLLEGDIDDKDALLFMEAENSGRQSPSLYETALAYQLWLDKKIFSSQSDLSKKMGISRVWVNKILPLSKIPVEIVQGFLDPNDLTLKRGMAIVKELEKSFESRNELLKRCHDIIGLGLESKDYFSRLINYSQEKNLYKNRGIRNDKDIDAYKIQKMIYTSDGKQEVCKISTFRNGQTVIKFNKKLPERKIINLLLQFEKIAEQV